MLPLAKWQQNSICASSEKQQIYMSMLTDLSWYSRGAYVHQIFSILNKLVLDQCFMMLTTQKFREVKTGKAFGWKGKSLGTYSWCLLCESSSLLKAGLQGQNWAPFEELPQVEFSVCGLSRPILLVNYVDNIYKWIKIHWWNNAFLMKSYLSDSKRAHMDKSLHTHQHAHTYRCTQMHGMPSQLNSATTR